MPDSACACTRRTHAMRAPSSPTCSSARRRRRSGA